MTVFRKPKYPCKTVIKEWLDSEKKEAWEVFNRAKNQYETLEFGLKKFKSLQVIDDPFILEKFEEHFEQKF